MKIDKKIFYDEAGEPQEVMISWANWCQIVDLLGIVDDYTAQRRKLLANPSVAGLGEKIRTFSTTQSIEE